MDWIEITEEDTEQNVFNLSVIATIRYGINHAYLDKNGMPRKERGHEALVFANQLFSLVELGIGLSFINLKENRELRDFITGVGQFIKRQIGDRANIPSIYISGMFQPLPIDDYLHEKFRFPNENIFVQFELLRAVLEKVSLLPSVDEIVPIVYKLIRARIDEIEGKDDPRFETSLKSLVITGSYGVGKTEIAHNLMPVLNALGYIHSEKVYTYIPDNEVRPGSGSTEVSLNKIITDLKNGGGGVIIVDDVHKVMGDLARDPIIMYKTSAINLLVSKIPELRENGIFVIFAGTRQATRELLGSIESAETSLSYVDLTVPTIEQMVEYVSAHMAMYGIFTHAEFEDDLAKTFQKLSANSAKFGHWRSVKYLIAQLRILSKGDRLFEEEPEIKSIDGEKLSMACRNLGSLDTEHLDELATHKIRDTSSESEGFELGLERLRSIGGDGITG